MTTQEVIDYFKNNPVSKAFIFTKLGNSFNSHYISTGNLINCLKTADNNHKHNIRVDEFGDIIVMNDLK